MSGLADRMEIAERTARLAGQATLRWFGTDLDVERKADETPVTVADRESEAVAVKALLEACPDDGVLGEEGASIEGTSGYTWIIDPIDGTKSFIRGVPLYGTLVGLTDANGEAVAGAACMPALDEMVVAARGLGCHRDGVRVRVSEVGSLADACVAFTSERVFRVTDRLGAHHRLTDRAGLIRGWTDCYAHVLVATGRIEAAVDPLVSVWDVAAILPIVEEAGGVFTDWDGHRTIRGGSGISTNRRLAEELRSVLVDG